MNPEVEVIVIKYGTTICIILYGNKTYEVNASDLKPIDGVLNKYTIDINKIPIKP